MMLMWFFFYYLLPGCSFKSVILGGSCVQGAPGTQHRARNPQDKRQTASTHSHSQATEDKQLPEGRPPISSPLVLALNISYRGSSINKLYSRGPCKCSYFNLKGR